MTRCTTQSHSVIAAKRGAGVDRRTCDILIVGAGIAGASAGSALSKSARVIVLEQESVPGYHTTGRSAAFYSQTYGNSDIRALTRASHGFLTQPAGGFSETPLMRKRGALFIAREDQLGALDAELERSRALAPSIRKIVPNEALLLNGALRPDYLSAAIFDREAMDIDVHALHHGFLRRLRRNGGRLVTDARVGALMRAGGKWRATTPAGDFEAPVIVNAAGAWADVVAGLAGIAPVGLVPKRRSVITFAAPDGLTLPDTPLTIDIDEQFYFKSDAGVIMASPADETASAPCDAQPEELDIAIAADRIEKATVLQVRRILSKWAGLRSFVADKTPVVGFDDQVDGFFWLAGQGGYGIQTAPAMARAAAGLLLTGALPPDVLGAGLPAQALAVTRLRRRALQ